MDYLELCILLGWQIIVFCLFVADKYKSQRGQWRISEKTLILSSFLLGSIGAILGMIICNHKTSKLKFRVLIPLSIPVNILIILLYYLILKV